MKSHMITIPRKSDKSKMPKGCRTAFVLICAAIVFTALFICDFHDHQVISVLSNSIWKIEPETPQNMDDPPYGEPPFPTRMVPIQEVIQSGTEIPLQFAYNNPDWKRQAYKSYWHSSVGRWSYVPYRIHYAMHRIFVTYPTASVFYDFAHDIGVEEISDQFQIPARTPYENIVLVVMQTKVEKIVTLGNQVAVIGRPALIGLQVLLIPVKEVKPYNPDERILFQLVTNEGDEIDYDSESYVMGIP